MRYADIKTNDISNGEGFRVSLWVTGCPIHCVGCHNENIWSKETGDLYTANTQDRIIELLGNTDVEKNLSILGGEPLAHWNYDEVFHLCRTVKALYPHKTIWVWTGYTLDQIKEMEIMRYIDVLIDGKYIESLKDEDLQWRGSSNQRIYKIENGLGVEYKDLT